MKVGREIARPAAGAGLMCVSAALRDGAALAAAGEKAQCDEICRAPRNRREAAGAEARAALQHPR